MKINKLLKKTNILLRNKITKNPHRMNVLNSPRERKFSSHRRGQLLQHCLTFFGICCIKNVILHRLCTEYKQIVNTFPIKYITPDNNNIHHIFSKLKTICAWYHFEASSCRFSVRIPHNAYQLASTSRQQYTTASPPVLGYFDHISLSCIKIYF